MKTAYVLALAFLLATLAPATSSASRIALKIDPSSVYKPGAATVTVKLTNLGDEPAQRVWTEVVIGQGNARSTPVESLPVKETVTNVLKVTDIPTAPGIYTVIVKARCTDANGHPFSALKSIPLIAAFPEEGEREAAASLSSLDLKTKGEAVLHVSAPLDTAIRGTATLVLPDALACPDTIRNIDLGAGSSTDLSFVIHRQFARPRSRYLVLAVVDYSLGGRHRSIVAQGSVFIAPPAQPFAPEYRIRWLVIIALILAIFTATQFVRRPAVPTGLLARLESIAPAILLVCIACFLFHHIPPALLVSDTLAVGGDTPAHSYLAGHLKTQLAEHGRIVSWSNGWWCGFPMFQFYFCLPYLLMALLSLVVPMTVALKIVSVAGIFLLPCAAWLAGRIMRLPKPTPSLLAIATLPVLFDPSHTMWGVNIYSTLAGMIANSISFPIMILFLASAARDAGDGQFRLRTVFLLAAVAASHFFTLVIACLSASVIPLLHGRGKIRPALWVLVREGGLGLLLMSWWFVPLVAKRQYSVDFGVNWPADQLPSITRGHLPLTAAAAALVLLAVAIARKWTFVGIVSHMLLASSLLFLCGYQWIGRVFQNIRFWPFICYAAFTLIACLVGAVCRPARSRPLAAAAMLVITVVFGTGQPNHLRSWARWNYEGLQGKARWPVFRDLLIPQLKDTPGRLANDLHPDNASLGSSRIFECVPHVIGKPVLEGGIVNSAAGSIFSYYVQGETSQNSAGFPNIVQPAAFNFTNATRHLALFNVKHFVARWSGTREALARSPHWHRIGQCQGWELYELTTHDGSYVFVPRNDPIPVTLPSDRAAGREWKEAGLDWIYSIGSIDQHYALLSPGQQPPAHAAPAITRQQLTDALLAAGKAPMVPGPADQAAAPEVTISDEHVTDHSITFRTSAPGRPHIIKCTYYPNWKVRGAERVYMVTPCFMLVYPDTEEVELYYGHTLSDNIGRALSCAAALLVGAVFVTRLVRRRGLREPEVDPPQAPGG